MYALRDRFKFDIVIAHIYIITLIYMHNSIINMNNIIHIYCIALRDAINLIYMTCWLSCGVCTRFSLTN